jgi:hypothetical protein
MAVNVEGAGLRPIINAAETVKRDVWGNVRFVQHRIISASKDEINMMKKSGMHSGLRSTESNFAQNPRAVSSRQPLINSRNPGAKSPSTSTESRKPYWFTENLIF